MNTNIYFLMCQQEQTFFHDVDVHVGDANPIKQHPYLSYSMKQQILKEEIQYLLENDFTEPSKSEWSSSCILVPKT